MQQYLQIGLIIPGLLFYGVKFISPVLLLVSFLTPRIYSLIIKNEVKHNLIYQSFSIFFLNFSQRLLLSPSAFYRNNPEVYQISLREIISFLVGLGFSCYFLKAFKDNSSGQNKGVTINLYLGLASIIELVVSALVLFLNGFSVGIF